jgi:hypothetical protein
MLRNLVLAIVASAAVGCGFTPEAGEWLASGFTIVSDTCPEDDDGGSDELEDAPFWLFVDDDGEVALGFDADATGDDRVACTLEGRELGCPAVDVVDLTEFDLDYVLTLTTTLGGRFSGPDALDGTLSLVAVCVGADCEEGESCEVEATFDGTLAE